MIDSESVAPKKALVMKTRGITAIGSASLVALLAGFATPTIGTAPTVPDNLKVPAMQTLSLETHAAGVQIYDCKPGKDDPARFEWAFRAPEADLFDARNRSLRRQSD